jgi:hypothetical protein
VNQTANLRHERTSIRIEYRVVDDQVKSVCETRNAVDRQVTRGIVKRFLRSDYRGGVHLSGGVDNVATVVRCNRSNLLHIDFELTQHSAQFLFDVAASVSGLQDENDV